MKFSFCFPEGRSKVLTFSYDDGSPSDRRLVEIFNRYGMKGTFNLNACHYQENPEEGAELLKSLYLGHEIACHGKTHPFLERMPQMPLVEEILEDRKFLEHLTESIIDGMAYPFGTYNANVLHTLNALGIRYARTVKSTGGFGLPDNFLEWNPTCHHRENIGELGDRFLLSPYSTLFYVWGHSSEFERNDDWYLMEQFCEKMAGKAEIWYATNREICRYLTAQRRLVTSADGHIVHNPSAQDVWLWDASNHVCRIPGGETIVFA